MPVDEKTNSFKLNMQFQSIGTIHDMHDGKETEGRRAFTGFLVFTHEETLQRFYAGYRSLKMSFN